MKYLRRFNDFNFFFGILFVLDCFAVRRFNWSKYLLEGLFEYTLLFDSLLLFKVYRDVLVVVEFLCILYFGFIF